MIHRILLSVFAVGIGMANAQDRYVIQIKDKNNSPFSFANPAAFLSTRAIQRRAAQGIPLDSTDLPVNPAYVSQVSAAGAAILGASRWLNTITIETTSPAVLAAVNALPFVASSVNVGRQAGPGDGAGKFALEHIDGMPAPVQENNKTASFNYGPGFNQVAMVGGDVLHDNGFTGAGYVIAVIDAGFFNADNMTVFDSLFADGRVLATYDFIDNDTIVFDDGSHGSYVLSVMASNWPGVLVGAAPGASYLLLRSEHAPTEYLIEEYDWAEAAEFADSAGADVINSSLSYTEFEDSTQNHVYADLDGDITPVTRAADFAAKKGIVVCNSAGNAGTSPWFYIGAPADADSILTIGGVDSAGVYIPFSSKGPTADGRIKPDVAAQAFQTYVAELFNGGAIPGNGTSFSCPIMAGMAACLWQCHPSATNMQIIEALRQSGSQAASPDSLMGFGIPDVPQACLILSAATAGNPVPGDVLSVPGPNPFTDHLEFSFHSASRQTVVFTLTDLAGRVLYRSSKSMEDGGDCQLRIPVGFAPGVYVLAAQSARNILTRKVIRH